MDNPVNPDSLLTGDQEAELIRRATTDGTTGDPFYDDIMDLPDVDESGIDAAIASYDTNAAATPDRPAPEIVDGVMWGKAFDPPPPNVMMPNMEEYGPLHPQIDATSRYMDAANQLLQAIHGEFGEEAAADFDPVLFAAEMEASGVLSPYEMIQKIREGWKDVRSDASYEFAESAVETNHWLQRAVEKVMGSPKVNVAMGVLEPFSRPQQALFRFGATGDWSYAVEAFRPKVVIQDPKTGMDKEVDPWTVAIDNIWGADQYLFDKDGNLQKKDGLTPHEEAVMQANEQMFGEGRFLMFQDVVEQWIPGEDNIAKVNAFLSSLPGPQGMAGRGGLSATLFLGDIFADPLFFMPSIRKYAARGMKRAMTTSAGRARWTQAVAEKTKTVKDIGTGLKAARDHLDKAKARYQKLVSAGTNTTDDAKKVVQAVQHVEELESLQRQRKVGPYSPVNFDAVEIVEDAPIFTREVSEKPYSAQHVDGLINRRQLTRNEIKNKMRRALTTAEQYSVDGANTNPRVLLEVQEEVKYWEWLLEQWDQGWRPALREVGTQDVRGNILHRGYNEHGSIGMPSNPNESPMGVYFTQGAVTPYKRQLYATATRADDANVLSITREERVKMIQAEGKNYTMPDQVVVSPAPYALKKLGREDILEELPHVRLAKDPDGFYGEFSNPILVDSRTGKRALVQDIIDRENKETSAIISAASAQGKRVPDGADMRSINMDLLLSEGNINTHMLAEFAAARLAREAGYDAIHLQGMDQKMVGWIAGAEIDVAAKEGRSVKRLAHGAQLQIHDQYVALTKKAYNQANGVPLGQRAYHDDLVDISRQMSDDLEKMAVRRNSLLSSTDPDDARLIKEIDAGIEEIREQQDRANYILMDIVNGNVERVPAKVEFGSRYVRERTAEELRDVLERKRIRAREMGGESVQPRHSGQMTIEELSKRDIQGPGDPERAAQTITQLMEGADPEDVTMPMMYPDTHGPLTDGNIVYGVGPENIIQKEVANARIKELYKGRKAQFEIEVPHARPGKTINMPREAPYTEAARLVDEGLEYDPGWLGSPTKTTGEIVSEGWHDKHFALNYDKLTQGFYPGTYMIKFPALITGTAAWMREPMRVVESADPGVSWPMLHGAMRNATTDHEARTSRFARAVQQFGAVTIEEPNAIKKTVLSNRRPKIVKDEKAGKNLMRILEIPRNTDEYAQEMAKLTPAQRQAVATIREELDHVAKQFGFYGNVDKFIEGYMPHVHNLEDLEAGIVPPHMRGMPDNANVFMRFLLNRNTEGGDYVRDPMALLELYSRAASNKLIVEPALKRFRDRAQYIGRTQPGMGWYPGYADGVVRQAKGVPSKGREIVDHIARSIAEGTGRVYRPGKMSQKLMTLTGAVYSALLAGNRRYPLMAIGTNVVTSGAELGMFRTMKGAYAMATPEGQALFKAVGGDKMWADIFEATDINRMTDVAANVRIPMVPSIQDTERFIRGVTFHAAIDEALDAAGYRTLQEAMDDGMGHAIMYDAVRVTQEVNHFFGPMGKPPSFSMVSKSGAAAVTQFKSFIPKQSEQILAMSMRDPGKLADYVMYSGWLARVAAEEMGVNMRDYTGFGYVPKGKQAIEASPALKILTSMTNAVAAWGDVAFGDGDPILAQAALDEFLQASEKSMPMYSYIKSISTGGQMLEGVVQAPGVGNRRPADLPTVEFGGGEFPVLRDEKGNRGEAGAFWTGLESEVARMNREARSEMYRAKQEQTFEQMRLIQLAAESMDNGDWDQVQEHIQKMAEANMPIGDMSDPVIARQRIDSLYWIWNAYIQYPSLRLVLTDIMGGELGDQYNTE
jgi:hypothetical protein